MQDASSGQIDKYKIVFRGELKPRQDLISVKARLAALLGVRGELVEKLFQGGPVLVSTDLPLDEAQFFKLKFEKTGAVCHMLDVSAAPPAEIKPRPVVSARPSPGMPSPSPQTGGSSSPQPAAAGVNSQFTFRRHEKKSNAPAALATGGIIVGVLIIIGIIIGITTPKQETSKSSKPSRSSRVQKRSSTGSALLSNKTKSFNDPKGYYSIALPEGYKISNKSAGSRSKITFSYSKNTSVSVLASPMRKQWDPQAEMTKKVTDIQRGRAGAFSRYRVAGYGLVNFGFLDGYQIILRKKNEIAHAYAMVSDSSIAFSIAIISMGKNSQENHDTLDTAVKDSLMVY